MSHQVFVPVTDDLIYNHPEQIEGPLVPYTAGMECQDWLSIEINPDESKSLAKQGAASKSKQVELGNLRLAYSA